MVFGVTYYLELRGARSLYQVKFLVFFNVQTTDLTIVGMMWDVHYLDIALCNSKL